MLSKIFGCSLIIISSLIIGIEYKKAIHKRIQGLSQMIELLSALKIKINYEHSPIPILLNEIYNQDRNNIFLKLCVTYLNQGKGLKEAWNDAVNKFAEICYLDKSDISILKDFSLGLGDSDLSGQTTNLMLFIKMLETNKVKAEDEQKDKSRITLSVCAFGGLVFAIILI